MSETWKTSGKQNPPATALTPIRGSLPILGHLPYMDAGLGNWKTLGTAVSAKKGILLRKTFNPRDKAWVKAKSIPGEILPTAKQIAAHSVADLRNPWWIIRWNIEPTGSSVIPYDDQLITDRLVLSNKGTASLLIYTTWPWQRRYPSALMRDASGRGATYKYRREAIFWPQVSYEPCKHPSSLFRQKEFEFRGKFAEPYFFKEF